MKRCIFPLAVVLCLFLVVSQHATVTAKDTWVSVRTKNFTLLGNADEKDIRKVGLRLEQFREVFTRLFPRIKFNTPVPTTVIVFKNDSSYRPFKPNATLAGYFQPGPDVNYITLTTEVRGEQDAYSVIFHEYTHLMVENTFPDAPTWFNEGLAEYYSTFSISDDQKIVLGSPIGHHVFLLRDSKMLPLKTLFEVDQKSPHYNEKNKQSIFYAQSWALMHYLIIGKTGKNEQLGKFMELLRAKMLTEQAFQQAFETPYEVMEKDLREYVRKDRYNVMRGHFERKLELDDATEATVLTEAEAQAYLGDLLLHSNRKEAYTYLEKALQLDPNLAMAHASLGMAYFREGKDKEAYASLERAVAANSQNYLTHYYYAFTLSQQTRYYGPVMTGYPPELIAKIKDHLQKAIALRPDYLESYKLLAFLSVVTGQGLDEAVSSMKRVLSITPGRHDFMNMLGQLYLRKENYKAAREMLEQVVKSNANEEIRRHSESLLKQLEVFETEKARLTAARKQDEAAAERVEAVVSTDQGNSTVTQSASDPSAYLREVLRTPGAGETQLQAKLVRIECEPKSIVFVLETANGLLRLRTPGFDDVEITTYDPKVNGEITCGARKPENVVVVCYLPTTDKRVKVDGALKSIEFVPPDFKLKS